MGSRPDIVLITVDDMNWDAVGAYGCPVPGATPNIDRLAAEGIRFEHAHVTIAVCQPSRSAIMTGRYPHRSGGEGLLRLRHCGILILPDLLRQAGYRVGILGKVTHSTPQADFEWDMTYDREDLGHGRNPGIYRRHAETFIRDARDADTPFFLMLNAHDPHRPFYGNDKPEWYEEGDGPPAVAPSRTFDPDEIAVPGFLPDLPDVRREVAEYYNSVRRCDDTVGGVLEVLRDAGCEEETVVLFLSDNGMAFPFAKTNCYLHSTRTPLIVRWPGVIPAGSHDTEHFVSGIDVLPTVLDAIQSTEPSGIDGASVLPVCRGERQAGREMVFTQFHQTAGKRNYPMRCVQNRRFGYIFNAWSDGERLFRNESQDGRTMAAMREAAKRDDGVAARVDHFLYRTPEELYDFANDPHAETNLIDDPAYAAVRTSLQAALEQWMEENDDPALAAFRNRGSREALDRFITQTAHELGGEA